MADDEFAGLRYLCDDAVGHGVMAGGQGQEQPATLHAAMQHHGLFWPGDRRRGGVETQLAGEILEALLCKHETHGPH